MYKCYNTLLKHKGAHIDTKRLNSLKWIMIVYICVSLLGSYAQISIVKQGYSELARNSKMIIESTEVDNKYQLKAYVDSAMLNQWEKLPAVFFISLWEIISVIAIFFIIKFSHSCFKIIKKKSLQGIIHE